MDGSARRAAARIALVTGVALAMTVPLLTHDRSEAATVSLSVNLAAPRGPATGVGEGILYGINQDGSQPGSQFIQPLRLNAFRGGGHVSRGWIGDNYRFSTSTQADLNSITAQARRLPGVQYQMILSDVYGADGGQPANTMWPCTNGDCSNFVTFIDSVVGALQGSGLRFAYDVWNEPDISAFWPNASVNSTQYFQMWDTGVREIRRIAPGALIVGPSFAFTPQSRASQWQTWLAHVKAAGTLPDVITNHLEGDGDDPVGVGQSIRNALSSNGIAALPLSANEYQPRDRQSAGVTAWYVARFAQSGYANAMRGNWNCCLIPNMTGLLTDSGTAANGNWWVLRDYADVTGSLVTTSGQVGTTAIAAAEDSSARRAVAILGDGNAGFTGTANVTFSGLASVPWLAANGNVNVVVHRIPDQTSLGAPLVVLNQNMSAASGSITVSFGVPAVHDAFAVYLTPATGTPPAEHTAPLVGGGSGRCLDVTGVSQTPGTQVEIWDCNGGVNQLWHQTAAGELRVYGDTRCLDALNQGTGNGTRAVISSCGGQASQQWRVNTSGTVTGVQSGRCLDVSNAATGNGAAVQLWDCNGQTNQQWRFSG
jgi:Ricin-type beta-trefoil lectin domain